MKEQDIFKELQEMQKVILNQLIKIQTFQQTPEKNTIQQSLVKCSENLNSLSIKSITNGGKDE